MKGLGTCCKELLYQGYATLLLVYGFIRSPNLPQTSVKKVFSLYWGWIVVETCYDYLEQSSLYIETSQLN